MIYVAIDGTVCTTLEEAREINNNYRYQQEK